MTSVHDLIARNRAGERVGLPSFCTANEHVLRTILAHAARTGFPTLIEATCNQVNQEGGYTGMDAAAFMAWVKALASEYDVPPEQLILGGDHLGPNPWRAEPVEQALEKASILVRSYVEAGFTKIHLDASMACGGEPVPSFVQIAERAADLCAIAERHAPDPSALLYVIGTEVPVPGGETEEPAALDVTSVARFHDTIETHRTAFAAKGLDAAWTRVAAVVTQPGVDFGHSSVYPFAPAAADPLRDAIAAENGLTFEAHSTDYQPDGALSALVGHHFFFLKVGPELTFRHREAVLALADIHAALHPSDPAPIRRILQERMDADPTHWRDHYRGAPEEVARLRIHSYSDRIRYYWSDPKVAAALDAMLHDLTRACLPETVVSQAFMGLEFGAIPGAATELHRGHVERCVRRYYRAAGFVEEDRT